MNSINKKRKINIIILVLLIISLIAGLICFVGYFRCLKNNNEALAADKILAATNLSLEDSFDSIAAYAHEIQEERSKVTICMVGDILTHDRVFASAKKTDGGYDYRQMFKETKDFISARDVAIVNQEVIIGGEDLGVTGYPTFNAPYELADALVDSGFDIVCHGTNHALDRKGVGVRNCLTYWQTKYPNIEILGIHDSAEDQERISILEIKGHKIAFLNYTYGTNGIPLPADMPFAVDYLSEERVISDIKRAEREAEFTVVLPHWGSEYLLTTDYSQQKWTKIFLENGVDLVIGTHSHVIEPVEVVTDENGNSMLVYYSLGNYVNWSARTGSGVANQMVGGIADVTIKFQEDEKPKIIDYAFVPIVTDLHYGENGVQVYFLKDYTSEQAKNNEAIKQDPGFSLEYCIELVKNVCGEKWVAW